MNKSIASFIFSGETLFQLKDEVVAPKEVNKVMEAVAQPVSKKKFSKKTVVIVENFTTEQQDFLLKIMASVNVAANSLEIIEKNILSEYDLNELANTSEFIVFGSLNGLLGFTQQTPKYGVQSFQNKKLLLADNLVTIGANQANEKRNLWNALKQLYGLA